MLTYDDATHVYALEGKRLLSVTQVLQIVGIVNPNNYPAGAAERGREVHAAAEMVDLSGELPRNEQFLPYAIAWQSFLEHKQLRGSWDFIEQPMCNEKLGYAGTPDRISTSQRLIVDIKSGIEESWHPLQTAGYAYMLDKPLLWDRWCVYLHKDATYSLKDHKRDKMQQNIAVFLSALAIAQWRQVNGR
jgi:hypothetical protein